MPYRLFLMSVLFTASLFANPGYKIPCRDCPPLRSEMDSVVAQGKTGDWGFYLATIRTDGFFKPDSGCHVYQVQDIRRTMLYKQPVVVQKNKGITEEQATIAFCNPDSLMKEIATSYDGVLWLVKSQVKKGLTSFDDPDAGATMILFGEKALPGTSSLSIIMLLCLIFLLIFGIISAYSLTPNCRLSHASYVKFGIALSLAMIAIIVKEVMMLIGEIGVNSVAWPSILIAVNLGAVAMFAVIIIITAKDQFKIYLSPKLRFEIRGSIKDWVIPLGVVTPIEIAFLAGFITNNVWAMLSYFGIFIWLIFIILWFPAIQRYRAKRRPPKSKPATAAPATPA